MDICLITPAAENSRSGNHTTAVRWRNILQSLGHKVSVEQKYSGQAADLMVALHAWRSASSIQNFADKHPAKPLVVALTGTDAYQFIHTHPEQTLQSIKLADRLVGLHTRIAHSVPSEYRNKARVIYQSTETKQKRRTYIKRGFQICVAGHLRHEKDSLRPAYATRSLPTSSGIQISHYGKAHTKNWERNALLETAKNRRYQWYGEISQPLLRFKFSQSHLLVLPSRMEGGANIISEAIMANLPVIASNIDGSIGLLGEDYLGYFQVEDTKDLRNLLLRCERDSKFYQTLIRQCKLRRGLFTPAREQSSWEKLLAEF